MARPASPKKGIAVLLLAGLLGAAVLSPETANASVLTQSQSISGATYNGESFGGAFHQFDAALGTLQSVTVSFSGTVSYAVTFALDPTPGAYPFAEFSFSTGYSFNAPGFPVTSPGWTPDFFSLVNWGGGADQQNLAAQSHDGTILYQDSTLDLADYIGAGTVLVDGSLSEDSDVCTDAGIAPTCQSTIVLTTTLTYDYVPVPEPMTLALLGMGLVGLGVARRKAGAEADDEG